MQRTRRTRSGERTSEPGFDGYKVIVVVVTGLLTLFFLLLTIMPIILFETLEDMSWELKTFATSYRPLVALIGLVLFLVCGWSFMRLVRGPQALARVRRIRKPAQPEAKPAEVAPPTATETEEATVSTAEATPAPAEEPSHVEPAPVWPKTPSPAPTAPAEETGDTEDTPAARTD